MPDQRRTHSRFRSWVGLFGLGLAVGHLPMTIANAAGVPSGVWSARGAVLTIGAQRSQIEFDTGTAAIAGPLVVDGQGRFRTTAQFESYMGGPQRLDQPPLLRKATIAGRIVGDTLALTMQIDGERAPRRFSMTQGRAAKLIRPL